MATVSPTIRQRELGIRLRELRNAKGLTVEEVAGRLLCSATKDQPGRDRGAAADAA